MRIILASKSPRRRELLKNLGITDFEVIPAHGEERLVSGLSPEDEVRSIALGKAREVAQACSGDDVVIAADTLVFLDGEPLGKPASRDDAFRMLRALSGRSHSVLTGVAVIRGEDELCECESTRVFFRDLSDDEIEKYVDSGEPMDKAGAYGIQGRGSVFVPRGEGDYFNVMGLPVARLYLMLRQMGIFNLRR